VGKWLGSAVLMAVVLCPFVASAHNPIPGPLFTLEDMVILTDGDINIGGFFNVLQGSICSRTGNINLGGAGGTAVRIPIGACADTSSDVIAATGTINLGNYVYVAHTRGNVVKTGLGGCQNLKDPAMACPDNPPFPSFSASNNAADDLVCTASGTNIVPGTYRDLKILQNGKCNFRGPGDYNFRRVSADVYSRYQLNFLDRPAQCDPDLFPFNLNVKEFMFLAEYGLINADKTPSVFFHVEGTDGTYGGANKSPLLIHSAFTYMGDGVFFTCYVFVPNGTIGLRGHGTPNTRWIGEAFAEIPSLTVNVAGPLNPECCAVERDCACIINFFDKADFDKTVIAGSTIRLIGKGFKGSTVSQVLFYKTTNNVHDVTNPAATADCFVNAAGLTFVSETAIDLTIPGTCTPGVYHIGLVDGTFCVNTVEELKIN
jgi:hypothetical protein